MPDNPHITIYKTSHRDVLQAWEKSYKDTERWRLAWLAQVEAWGFDKEVNKPFVSNSAWGSGRLIGVNWGYGREPLPPGWKRVDNSRNRHILEPYRSKPKGDRKIQAEFDALIRIPDLRRALVPLGMPANMFLGLSVTAYAACIVTPEFEFADPEIWVKWHGVDPLASDQWWTKVKLSEYYAMVEAGNDPFAKDEVKDDEE